MDWNRLILMGGIALTVAALPAATAQPSSRGPAAPREGAAGANIAASGARSFPASAGARVSAGGGHHWQNGDPHHWDNHRWHRWHHHAFYPYYSFYPYGYPFWGSSFYFSDSRSAYSNRGSGSVIVDVQRELARAGYYRGAIDGALGSGTRRAIRLYERANGLPVDGRIDSDLLATMGLG